MKISALAALLIASAGATYSAAAEASEERNNVRRASDAADNVNVYSTKDGDEVIEVAEGIKVYHKHDGTDVIEIATSQNNHHHEAMSLPTCNSRSSGVYSFGLYWNSDSTNPPCACNDPAFPEMCVVNFSLAEFQNGNFELPANPCGRQDGLSHYGYVCTPASPSNPGLPSCNSWSGSGTANFVRNWNQSGEPPCACNLSSFPNMCVIEFSLEEFNNGNTQIPANPCNVQNGLGAFGYVCVA